MTEIANDPVIKQGIFPTTGTKKGNNRGKGVYYSKLSEALFGDDPVYQALDVDNNPAKQKAWAGKVKGKLNE